MIKLKNILNEGRKVNKKDPEEVEYLKLAMEFKKKIKNISTKGGYEGVYPDTEMLYGFKGKDMEEPEFDFGWMSLPFTFKMSIPEWHDDGNKADASETKDYLARCEKALLEGKGLKKIMTEYNKIFKHISKKPDLFVTKPEKTSELVSDRKHYSTQYRTYTAVFYFSIWKVSRNKD